MRRDEKAEENISGNGRKKRIKKRQGKRKIEKGKDRENNRNEKRRR